MRTHAVDRDRETHTPTEPAKTREADKQTAEVIDLMAVLKKSLDGGGNGSGASARRGPGRAAAKRSAGRPMRSQSTARSRRTA